MANGTLAGSVRDIRNGQPIGDAAIDARSGDGGEYKATSSPDGSWSVDGPAGTYEVTVTATGYEPGDYPGIIVIDGVTTDLSFAISPSEY